MDPEERISYLVITYESLIAQLRDLKRLQERIQKARLRAGKAPPAINRARRSQSLRRPWQLAFNRLPRILSD